MSDSSSASGGRPNPSEQWFFCLKHQTVEPAGQCRSDDRMGPYESPEAAANWRERMSEREEQRERTKDSWEREDDAWRAGPGGGA